MDVGAWSGIVIFACEVRSARMAKPACPSRTLTSFWQCTLAQDAILIRWSSDIRRVRCYLMRAYALANSLQGLSIGHALQHSAIRS